VRSDPFSVSLIVHVRVAFLKAGFTEVGFFWRGGKRKGGMKGGHGRDGMGVHRCLWNRAGKQATRIE